MAAFTSMRKSRAQPCPIEMRLLEPTMNVSVNISEEFAGSLIGDLNLRRGVIVSAENSSSGYALNALVPAANMSDYNNDLRLMTKFQGEHTMVYDHHAPVPGELNDDPDIFPPAVGMRA